MGRLWNPPPQPSTLVIETISNMPQTFNQPGCPNILVIITDQQRADTMACYGNDWIQTPNMNALAASSFVFENAYVTQPVCTPSRSTMLTGSYPHTNGLVRNSIALAPDALSSSPAMAAR